MIKQDKEHVELHLHSFDIYLDIDGVLRGTSSPIPDIERFLSYCLLYHPSSTYWLTTHCRCGCNRTKEALAEVFSEGFAEQVYRMVQPTDWNVLKTEAIDFSRPFVWLDNSPLYSERAVLEQQHAVHNLLVMDKHNPDMARKALDHLMERARNSSLVFLTPRT